MSTISVYAFESHGDESATEWTTSDYREAEEYAKANGYSIIEREYEYSDSSLVADFRRGHDSLGFPLAGHICGDEEEIGQCDECDGDYLLAERSVDGSTAFRCGDCGNCSLHCPPEHPRTNLVGA